MSKNPLERAWPRWDQRRLSNRREQILHFDLSRKGREAITNRETRSVDQLRGSLRIPCRHQGSTVETSIERGRKRTSSQRLIVIDPYSRRGLVSREAPMSSARFRPMNNTTLVLRRRRKKNCTRHGRHVMQICVLTGCA